MKRTFQAALILAFSFAPPGYAKSQTETLHEYRGELTIQSVAGKSCNADSTISRKFSLIWRKVAGGKVEGYIDGERMPIGRFSGKQLGALSLAYPNNDGMAHQHRMSIRLARDGTLTGSQNEVPPEQDDGECYFTAATFDMKERAQQDIPANRWQQATDDYNIAIARWQYSRYGEGVMPLQKVLTALEFRQRTEKETAFMPKLRAALNKQYPKLLASPIERVRLAAEQGDVLAQFELASRLAPSDAQAAFGWLARARINASFTAAQCSDPKARAVVGMARFHYGNLLDQVKPPQSLKGKGRWDWIQAEMRKATRKELKNFRETPRLPLPPWMCNERLPEKEIRTAQAELRKRIAGTLKDQPAYPAEIGDWLDREDLLNKWEELPLKREAWIKLDKLVSTLPPGQISGYERGLAAHRSGDIARAKEIWRDTVTKQTAPDENSACLAWEYLTEDRPDAGLYARENEIEEIAKQARSRIGQQAADALSNKLTVPERTAILAELSSMKSYEKCRDRAWRPPALVSAGFDVRIPEVLLNEAEWGEYLNYKKRAPEQYRNILNTYRAAGEDNAIGRTHAARLEEQHFPQARWAGILEDYRLSAEAGHRRAMILYADALERGDTYRAADIPAAIDWYRKAVDTIPSDVRKPFPSAPKGYRDHDNESDWARQRLSAYAKARVVKFTAAESQRYLTDEELLPKNCAAQRNEEPPKLPVSKKSLAVIDSQEWLKPNNCEVNVRIEIERSQPNRLVQHITPNWGGSTYPELLNFFMACVSGHYGTKYGYSHMRFVTPKERPTGLAPDGSFRFEVLLEKKDTGKKGETANAHGETFSDSYKFSGMRNNCSKMLADEYRW